MDLRFLYLLDSFTALCVIVQGFEIHVQKLECRALVLKKLYHVFLTRRYQTKGPEEKKRLYAIYIPFIRKTRHEYFTHPYISFKEKVLIGFLLLCPWAVWLMMKALKN